MVVYKRKTEKERERERDRERARASTAERGEACVGTKREVKKPVAAYHHSGVTMVTR